MLDSMTEWLILIGVIVVLFGGASRIPQLARSMGRAIGEFKKGQAEIDKEIEKLKQAETPAPKQEDKQ